MSRFVDIVKGHYAGVRGKFVSKVNSARDGVLIKIKVPGLSSPLTIREKNVEYLEPSTPHQHEKLVGKGATYNSSEPPIETSCTENSTFKLVQRKHCLITLVYDLDGQDVANIVFQGEYAVVPLSTLTDFRTFCGSS